MEHFKAFLIKLQTLDIKIVPKNPTASLSQGEKGYYDISHQNPYLSSQFRNELKELRELALTDLLNLYPEQIAVQLKRLNELKALFDSFWKTFYSTPFTWTENDHSGFLYSLNLGEGFIVRELSYVNHAIAKNTFIDDLQDSIHYRQQVLNEFEQSVLRILPSGQPQEKTGTLPLIRVANAAPVLKETAAREFFDLLKDYFVPTEQPLLKNLFTEGTDPGMPLRFKGKGNQLADAFKQLFEANLIVGCNKAELIHWIQQHFTYLDNGAVRAYSEKYLQDLISSNTKSCQSPILDVRKKEGQFFILPTQRNHRNNKI